MQTGPALGQILHEKNKNLLSQILENIKKKKIVALVQRNPCIDGEIGKLHIKRR